MGDLAIVGDTSSRLSASDLAKLRRAVRLLESNHLVVRMTALFGRSFNAGAGFAARFLPQPVRAGFHGVVSQALLQAVNVALLTSPSISFAVIG